MGPMSLSIAATITAASLLSPKSSPVTFGEPPLRLLCQNAYYAGDLGRYGDYERVYAGGERRGPKLRLELADGGARIQRAGGRWRAIENLAVSPQRITGTYPAGGFNARIDLDRRTGTIELRSHTRFLGRCEVEG